MQLSAWCPSRFRVAAVAVVLSVPLFAACAPASGEPLPVSAAANVSSETYNDADVRFSQEMIPHHQQTIQMAELVSTRTSNEYVLTVSEHLIDDERTEIRQMSAWLKAWNKPIPEENAKSTHSMPGMLSQQQMATMARQSGDEFDRTWLTLLSTHLGHGIVMVENVQGKGRHQPTLDLAGKLINGQRQQIAEIATHLD
jgi:uncharacterized protein (DUF305 family)